MGAKINKKRNNGTLAADRGGGQAAGGKGSFGNCAPLREIIVTFKALKPKKYHMKKFVLLMAACALFSMEITAGPGRIIVKGGADNTVAFNSGRGRDRASFAAQNVDGQMVVTIPEEATGDLVLLASGDKASYVRVLADQTVKVDAGRDVWKFSGDQKAVNNYLYGWTQMFYERPHAQMISVRMMMRQLPERIRNFPDAAIFADPEYQKWANGLRDASLAALKQAKLKDAAFVEQQKKLIELMWLEMLTENYQFAGYAGVEIPAPQPVMEMRFDDPSIADYAGYQTIVSGFFSMLDRQGAIDYTADTYVRQRADRLGAPELKEKYALDELNAIVNQAHYLYKVGENIDNVRDIVISPAGRERLAAIEKSYRDQMQAENNRDGKPLRNFRYTDRDGNDIATASLKGKFLLIDMWATWCGPCKAQIPALIELEEQLRDRSIEFLGVSADKPADREKWIATLDEFGLKGLQVISPDAFNDELFEYYEVTGIPRFMLVDPDGVVIASRCRRPTDPILAVQLRELLDDYDRRASWFIFENMPEGNVSMMRSGMMSQILFNEPVQDGKLTLKVVAEQPEFLNLGLGNSVRADVYTLPGGRMTVRPAAGGRVEFAGDGAAVTQTIFDLKLKYQSRQPEYSRDRRLDRKLSGRYVDLYNDMVKDVEGSSLSDADKRIVVGYLQGELLSNLYSSLYTSKVFGKGFPKPVVSADYSDPVVGIELLPEITLHPRWSDGVQEYLYAKLDKGMIKIQSPESYTADLASGLGDARLREEYVMYTFGRDIIMGYLVGLEERIENARRMVALPEHQRELDNIITKIPAGMERYEKALPGTDMSRFEFVDARGKKVALSDFRGKYIFIDLWSTGCNPCIGEIPYIKQMEHKLAGRPIVWVSISTDLDAEEWREFLVKEKMTGVQLLAEGGFRNPFLAETGCHGIPHFMLLDKEGRVVDFHTIRPSNPVLAEILKFTVK